MSNDDALFPRNFHQALPIAVRGEGCWLFSADGRKFLDAAGQAAVINIGHGVSEIGRAMAEQSAKLAFAHSSQFHSPPAEKLAAFAPAELSREHAGRDDRKRQRATPGTVSADARGMGPHRSLLLLPLPI
jgi:4-aminobutyrate aminotransferase-like enzyme